MVKTAKYEWLGDRGEISGHVVFEEGSKGRIVEVNEAIADEKISQGFPLNKLSTKAKLAKEEAV
ncbi:MAG: hypothetical protein JWN34_2253 [Bryobacterales bacterium]|nr:hypothetical protein [Bryobacterales bacterium]